MTQTSTEISVKGKWLMVPALDVDGKLIVAHGKWPRMAEIDTEEWLDSELENPEKSVRELKNQPSGGVRADIFTFAQMAPNTEPRHSYPMVLDSVAAIPLTTFDEWWMKLPQESRKNVRRAEKRGVAITVKELDDDLIRGLMDLNNDSPMRQGKPYTHYGKSFEQVRKDQESFPDRRELIWAHAGTELIGFLKIVYRGKTASILQLLPKASHHDKRPANALVAKAVEVCAAKGITCLTFGMFNYGNKRANALREFKIRNGFEELLIPRFYIPLTIKGAICMRLNLHRGLVGVLPHSVITVGVAARTKLYNVRQTLSRCSSILERSNRNRQMERANPPAGSNP